MHRLAWEMGRPLVTVSCHDDLSTSDLVGRYLLKGGEAVWVDGPLTLAVKAGAICYLDEIVEARKDTMVVIHPLADDRRELPIEKRGQILKALADMRAGRPSSDRLFVRLVRDTRDIATLFLVDMSSSTEGWVNQAIRESLVLLCESLSLLGDRYAIYGFSGMKRLRSEFYHIKHFDEPYGEDVKGRIAAIKPMDYTRMGPAIRHAAGLLKLPVKMPEIYRTLTT
jgi:hypothetical protein